MIYPPRARLCLATPQARLTMTLQDLEHHLRSLSPDEQADAIYLLVQNLGNPWRRIEKIPGVCGGRACIANTRIPIWGLIEAKRSGYSDADC